MLVIQEQLLKPGLNLEYHVGCEYCLSNPKACEKLKVCIQQLTNQGTVQVGHITRDEEVATLETPYHVTKFQIPVTPMMICVPSLFP